MICRIVYNHIHLVCVYYYCVFVDGTTAGATLWFPWARSATRAEVCRASQRTGLPEKHQRTGPSPAHGSRLVSAVNQSSYRAAYPAEGTSWGQSNIHLSSRKYTVTRTRLLNLARPFPRTHECILCPTDLPGTQIPHISAECAVCTFGRWEHTVLCAAVRDQRGAIQWEHFVISDFRPCIEFEIWLELLIKVRRSVKCVLVFQGKVLISTKFVLS